MGTMMMITMMMINLGNKMMLIRMIMINIEKDDEKICGRRINKDLEIGDEKNLGEEENKILRMMNKTSEKRKSTLPSRWQGPARG